MNWWARMDAVQLRNCRHSAIPILDATTYMERLELYMERLELSF